MSALNRARKQSRPIERIHVTAKFLIVLILFLAPQHTAAADTAPEKEIHHYLKSSLSLIDAAMDKCKTGKQCHAEISQIKKISDPLKASFLLLNEGFKDREKSMAPLGQTALKRHQVMADGYRRSLNEYFALIDSLSPQTDCSIQASTLKRVQSSLGKVLHKKQRPILGSLPYRNLNYPVKEPASATPIVPAYRGGNKTVTPDDLQGSPEAPVDKEIAALAQTLNWSPVEIYEYLKNNIETEWYWGSMKGAIETLRQKSGNDADQAALLVALLRASGFPARYVRGTIEFFPGIDKVKNLTGIEDPNAIAVFFQKAGIPFKPVISGGRIINFQIEHIWVESQIPYSNYRGAIIDEHGKTWLGLDTSIKVLNYQYSSVKYDIAAHLVLTGLRDEYLNSTQTGEPLAFLKTKIEAHLQSRPELFYGDLLRKKTLPPEEMQILPASLQFDVRHITHEYIALPEELKHQIKLTATKNNVELLKVTLNVQNISNQKVELTYEPESIEDQKIINSYGGLDNTPSYLVRLRPVIQVNGERIMVARDGLPMGEEFNLTVDVISPNGTESTTGTHIAGNLSILGITAQKTVTPQTIAPEEKTAGQLLYEEAINYIRRWNEAEDELASLLQLNAVRPLPTVVVTGGVIDVTYLLDQPHGYEWKGVYLDARIRAIDIQPATSGMEDRRKLFLQLSALQGSVLENKIFEDDFQVDAVSAAKLLQTAHEQTVSILAIDKTNQELIAGLPFVDHIKADITNAVNQNYTVRISNQEIAYQDWQGIGYIKENPETGEAGYMLSGMIAGGMTAWSIDKWPGDYASRLANAYTESPVYNPAGDFYIEKIPAGDLQKGIVGQQLSEPLQVKIYAVNKKDGKRIPVAKKEVTFTVVAGGGTFADGTTTKTEKTDTQGIAGVKLILGKETKANPSFMKIASKDTYSTQVGENIVTASLASGLSIQKPFTAYGVPDKVHHLTKTHGDNETGPILMYSGFLAVLVEDQYGNPISNKIVTFTISKDAEHDPGAQECFDRDQVVQQAELIDEDDSCIKALPVLGQCESRSKQHEEKSTVHGAVIGVVLGNLPRGRYHFNASTPVLAGLKVGADFVQYTGPFGACKAEDDPQLELIITYLYPADKYGNTVNGGKVGSKVDLQAVTYFLMEEGTTSKLTACDPPRDCDKVIGSGTYKIVPVDDAHFPSVTFGGEPGKINAPGLYGTAYTLLPGENKIPVNVSATLKQQNRTIVCPSCQPMKVDLTRYSNVEMILYGVDIIVDEIPAILVDTNGYTREDYKIKYTITPAAYKASTAYTFIYKNGQVIATIPTKTQGGDYVTIAKGFQFDLKTDPLAQENNYEAEVILNYDRGFEIRSGKIKMVVAVLDVESKTGRVVDRKFDETIEFGSGLTDDRIYHIILEVQSSIDVCNNDKLRGKLRIIDNQDNTIPTPDITSYGKAEYDLDFSLNGTACRVQLKDGDLIKEYFIRSSRKKEDLTAQGANLDDLAVLYAGTDNKTMIHINLSTVDGAKTLERIYPGKPMQVIVLAIDGLRQDVLYGPETQPASYADAGCGGASCYIPLSSLPGFRQILTTNEAGKQYMMLPDVTAIFPSVTLASWASVFTGKMPKETGITGNEFYARDISYGVPKMFFNPPNGMVTFDGGAFPGYSECRWDRKIIDRNFIVPYRNDWNKDPAYPMEVPQNYVLRSNVPTIFETLTSMDNIKKYYEAKGGDSVVVAYSHYARGASRWLTHGVIDAIPWGGLPSTERALYESIALDKASWSRFEEYLEGRYLKYEPGLEGTGSYLRNKVPFSALTVWYLPGLDHVAHGVGMGSYKGYFKDSTDDYIKKFVNWLKKWGEFDNKIFIIVADHGTTAMPENFTFEMEETYTDTYTGETIKGTNYLRAEPSCSLNLDFMIDPNNPDEGNLKQKTEQANNNLHIWELANLFEVFPSNVDGKGFKLLVPEKIASVVKKSTATDINQANIIAALNGPMAQIYVKGTDWQSEPDAELMKFVLNRFEQVLKDGNFATGVPNELIKKFFPKLDTAIETILVRRTKNGPYEVYSGRMDVNSVSRQDRISGLNDFNRSGDIVLIMKDKTTDDTIKRYTTGVACKAWHGSLNPSDSYVPLIVACPSGNRADIEKVIKNEIACKEDYSNCRGNWNLPDIIKEIITNQEQNAQ